MVTRSVSYRRTGRSHMRRSPQKREASIGGGGTIYSMFLGILLGISAISLHQQVKIINQKNSVVLGVPAWHVEFAIRQTDVSAPFQEVSLEDAATPATVQTAKSEKQNINGGRELTAIQRLKESLKHNDQEEETEGEEEGEATPGQGRGGAEAEDEEGGEGEEENETNMGGSADMKEKLGQAQLQMTSQQKKARSSDGESKANKPQLQTVIKLGTKQDKTTEDTKPISHHLVDGVDKAKSRPDQAGDMKANNIAAETRPRPNSVSRAQTVSLEEKKKAMRAQHERMAKQGAADTAGTGTEQTNMRTATKSAATATKSEAETEVDKPLVFRPRIGDIAGSLTKAISAEKTRDHGGSKPVMPIITMCPECESSFIKKKFACKRRLLPWIEKEATLEQLEKAQIELASQFEELCGSCHPEKCKGRIDFPFRFDDAQPIALKGRVLSMPSMTAQHRIPKEFLKDTQTYFKFRTQDRPPIFFLYNPTIVPIPKGANINVKGAAYIVGFRASPWHSCGFSTYNFKAQVVNDFGIALLDRHLTMINGTDTIVKVNSHPSVMATVINYQEYRLFSINNQLYLMDGSLISRIEIADLASRDAINDPLSAWFGNGLVVGIKDTKLIPKIKNHPNYNLFQDKKDRAQLEMWIKGPRQVAEIDMVTLESATGRIIQNDAAPSADAFETNEHFLKRPFLFGEDQPSACCVRVGRKYYKHLTNNTQYLQAPYLLVGISQRKTMRKAKNDKEPDGSERFHYLSRLYAFLPMKPFTVLVQSGMFCWQYPDPSEGYHEPYLSRTREVDQLYMYNKRYSCPTIQTATSMTENVEDSSRVIVAYGINDCVNRVVEVHKQDLAHRLFLPLSASQFYASK